MLNSLEHKKSARSIKMSGFSAAGTSAAASSAATSQCPSDAISTGYFARVKNVIATIIAAKKMNDEDPNATKLYAWSKLGTEIGNAPSAVALEWAMRTLLPDPVAKYWALRKLPYCEKSPGSAMATIESTARKVFSERSHSDVAKFEQAVVPEAKSRAAPRRPAAEPCVSTTDEAAIRVHAENTSSSPPDVDGPAEPPADEDGAAVLQANEDRTKMLQFVVNAKNSALLMSTLPSLLRSVAELDEKVMALLRRLDRSGVDNDAGLPADAPVELPRHRSVVFTSEDAGTFVRTTFVPAPAVPMGNPSAAPQCGVDSLSDAVRALQLQLGPAATVRK